MVGAAAALQMVAAARVLNGGDKMNRPRGGQRRGKQVARRELQQNLRPAGSSMPGLDNLQVH